MPDPNANRRELEPPAALPPIGGELSDELSSKNTKPGAIGKAAKPLPEPWLIDAPAAAALAGVSRRTWLRMNDAERVPAPVRLGRSVRWSRPELEHWIELGCPPRRRMPTRKGVRHGK